MNYNKLTKQQIIQQIESIKTENKNNNKKSLIQRLLEFWIFYKKLIFKLTIVATVVKIIRKYSIFSKIWRILNTIVMSIFGISMFDIYGFDIFYKLFKELNSIFSSMIDYLTNTHFYSILKNLFENKNISDNSSDGSDKTVTQQLNKYLPETKETKVKEFVQGNSTNSIQTRDITETSIPSVLFSSNFFDKLDEDIQLDDKTIKENDKEEDPQEIIIQEDDSINIIDTWDKVEVNIFKNDNINILFGRMSKDSKSIIINTTDNQEINYNLSFNVINNFTNDNFNWRSKLISNNSTIEINDIFIQDFNNVNHLIYSKHS
jgi:hypothetical protein